MAEDKKKGTGGRRTPPPAWNAPNANPATLYEAVALVGDLKEVLIVDAPPPVEPVAEAPAIAEVVRDEPEVEIVDPDPPSVVEEPPPVRPVVEMRQRPVKQRPAGARIVRNAPAPPPPKRKTVVKISTMGPASEEETWVQGGDTGLQVTALLEADGRPRLVKVNLAFVVRSHTSDFTMVRGDLRWWGLPADREEEWLTKLHFNNNERLNEIIAALEYFFSYADPRLEFVLRATGGPATDGDTAARCGYQWWAPKSPATKVDVDMSRVARAEEEIEDFYLQEQNRWFCGLRRIIWRRRYPQLEQRFLLGKSYYDDGFPPLQVSDGLTPNQRRAMMSYVAEMIGPSVASLGRIAWRGIPEIGEALKKRGLQKVDSATRYTVFEGEGDE